MCRSFRRALPFLLLSTSLWLAPTARPAAGLALIPNSISNTYSGQVTLQITGLTNGETVLIERFLDLNANGSPDSGESLAQSFQLTDGLVTSFGGIPDTDIPGDNDAAANGQAQSAISFSASAEFARAAGSHLFRLSSPGGRFAPVLQTLTVTQAAFGQRITGQITSGGSAVPYATVALLVQVGQDIQFVTGAGADGSGNFSIAAAAGTYLVLPAKPGLVSDIAASPVVTLNSGQVITTNLNLTAATRTISGRVTDAATGAGVPGVQLFIESTTANTIAFAFTDAGGNFTASVLADQWKINLSDFSLVTAGYLRPQTKPKVDTTSASVSGVTVPLVRVTALIYGSLKDTGGFPLPGISIFAGDSNSQYEGAAVTDGSGNYTLGVAGGIWYINPDNTSPGLAGYLVQGTNVTLAAGQAAHVDFVASRSTAHLIGRVIDSGGNAVSDVGIIATDFSGGNNQVQTGADGSFDLGVSGGTWQLQLESQTAAQRGLVGPSLQFLVTDGVNISNINYVVQHATAQLSGSVTNTVGNPVGNVFVSAAITLNGTNYIPSAQTDAAGHYQLGLFNGSWQVNVDCFNLNQQGYSCPNQQNVTINGANATLNFTVSPAPELSLHFRHFASAGDFRSALTPAHAYPVAISSYVARLDVKNDSNFPTPDQVFFTGPAGSGLTGSPAIDSVLDTNSAIYFSPRVSAPATAPGGNWSVSYRFNTTTFNNVPDPQAAARLFVPLPTVNVNSGNLQSLSWVYKDTNGATLSAAPAFVNIVQAQIFDRDLNLVDASPSGPPSTSSYSLASPLLWSNVGRIRMVYVDNQTNVFFLVFNRTAAGLTGLSRPANNQFQFTLGGLAGQNYTVQYSTTLTNWTTLTITNAPASSFNFTDFNASDTRRFYRVLSGP